jgi:hypothetical protein
MFQLVGSGESPVIEIRAREIISEPTEAVFSQRLNI